MQNTKLISFNNSSDSVSDLLCPRCGGGYLHHMGVTVYDRGEDAEKIVKVEVKGHFISTTQVENMNSGNPSRRRDGLAIHFHCETCSINKPNDVIELTIAQHKGCTEMAWRYS